MPSTPTPVDPPACPGLPEPQSASSPLDALPWQWLSRPDGVRMAWCEGGDPAGVPVLVLHGGPGGRTRWPSLQWWRDLPVRWIAFDQRGCGRSLPRGGLQGNDLPTLLSDMEALREHLGLPRWALAAGSWGSLLALAYAAWRPQAIRGLFLRSSFFGAAPELTRYMAPWSDWLDGAGRHLLGETATALQRLLCHGETVLCEAGAPPPALGALSQDARLAAAWAAFDAGQSAPGGVLASQARWQPDAEGASPEALWDWQIFLHLAAQGWGVGPAGVAWPNQAPGPVWLVHGQADAVCDPANSARLAAAWPQAHHVVVAGGAHAMSHPPMAAALQQAATDWVAALVAP